MILKISSCASHVNLVDSCARAVTLEEAEKSSNQETVLGNRGHLNRNQSLHGFLLYGLDIKCEEMLVLYSK